MSEINTFVHQARDKGLSDEAIRKALEAEGWAMPLIDTALLDIEVPKPSSEVAPASQPSHTSLSPLMAAMQHVLLWFFVASSTVTIASVVASLSGYNVSERVLASMIAVTLITFTPYAVLFLIYTLRLRKTPDLIPGKVWSIITICLHSVAAMAAGITLVVTLIVSGEFSVWLSALLILILDLIVLVTYVFAAFAGKKLQMVRKITVTAHLPILLVLFGTLFIMSLLQLGPAKHDEQLRKDLVSTAVAVREYATQHNTLPASNDTSVVKGSDIRYTKKTESTYELCADFQANVQRTNSYSYYYRDNQMTLSDDYPSEYQFEGYGGGEHCFTLQSSPLEDKRNPSYY
jgi:hypothetical protein